MIFLVISVTLVIGLCFVYFAYFLLMSRFQKIGANWIRSDELKLKVSLIVATYNEESTIPAKLKNILEQDYPKDQLELVIIDSGSVDRTSKIVNEFIQQNPNMNVLFIKEKERLGKSHAVNIAYAKASGDIKIISDADALLTKSAITRLVGNFGDPTVGAASGRQVLLNADKNAPTLMEKSYGYFYEVLREGESVLDSTPIFRGELAGYRANLIELLPENKSADDSRLANIIRAKGYRAVSDSTAVFYEYSPPNLKSIFLQKVRRGQGLIRVFWDFKSCMFKKKYGRYGQIILPMEFLMHCIFPSIWLILFASSFLTLLLTYPIMLLIILAVFAGLFVLGRTKGENGLLKKAKRISSITFNFFLSQLILVYALILWIFGRSLHKWQKVEEIRKKWKEA